MLRSSRIKVTLLRSLSQRFLNHALTSSTTEGKQRPQQPRTTRLLCRPDTATRRRRSIGINQPANPSGDRLPISSRPQQSKNERNCSFHSISSLIQIVVHRIIQTIHPTTRTCYNSSLSPRVFRKSLAPLSFDEAQAVVGALWRESCPGLGESVLFCSLHLLHHLHPLPSLQS